MMNELVETKNKVGRPLKFQNVAELQSKIDDYFKDCIDNDEPITITGLCLTIGTSRDLLLSYSEKDEFHDTILKAKLVCQHYAEKQIFKAKNPAGAIFALKNYGWSDKQEIDHTVTSKIITVDMIGNIDD